MIGAPNTGGAEGDTGGAEGDTGGAEGDTGGADGGKGGIDEGKGGVKGDNGGVDGDNPLISGTPVGFSPTGEPCIGAKGSPLGAPSLEASGSAITGFPTLRLLTTSTTPIVREATSMARSLWFAESTYPVSSICPAPLSSA